MTKNPAINALAASAYITTIALIMNFVSGILPHTKSIIAPIIVVSLFTLSAAVMGYIFLYHPFMLYFDGKKKQAATLFLQTIALFAIITTIILILLLTGVFR